MWALRAFFVNAPTDLVNVHCVVDAVGANYLDNTVAINGTNCTPSAGSIQFFIVVGTDTKMANQVLSMGMTAIATGKRVDITYDPNDTSVPSPEVVRKILTVGVGHDE